MATADTVQERQMSATEIVIRSPLFAWQFIRRWPVVPGFVIVVFGLATIFTTQFATDDPNTQNLRASFAAPAWNDGYYDQNERIDRRYLLGADQHGRDIYSRLVHGTRVSITVAFSAAVVGMTVGLSAGIASGWFGGWFDEIMTRFVDVWNGAAFPPRRPRRRHHDRDGIDGVDRSVDHGDPGWGS